MSSFDEWWEFEHVGQGKMVHRVTGARCGWSHVLEQAHAHRREMLRLLGTEPGEKHPILTRYGTDRHA